MTRIHSKALSAATVCALLTLVCSLPLACRRTDSSTPGDGSAHEPGSSTETTATSVESFCGEVSARLCAGLSACGCRFDVRPYDAEGCTAARTAACVESLSANVGADLASRKARFHEASVVRCKAALDGLVGACRTGDSRGLPSECQTIVVASAGSAQRCELSGAGLAYCAEGSGLCVPSDQGSPTCTTLPANGQPCLNGGCAPELTCVAERCVSPADIDEPCTQGSDCAAAAGLICTVEGRCAHPLSSGEVCDRDEQCLLGHLCEGGSCVPGLSLGAGCDNPRECGGARSCARAPEGRTCAEPDQLGDPCGYETCAPGLLCDSATTTCVLLPGDGMPCLEGYACAEGSSCVDGESVCRPLPARGQVCAVGARFCAAGLGCEEASNTCQPGPGDGQACVINPPTEYLCADGLGCDFAETGSFCVPMAAPGEPCHTDRTCEAGTYCDFHSLQCTPRLARGAACRSGNECSEADECALGAGGATCQAIPGRGEPCVQACTDGLACKGAGGICAPEICVIP